MDQYNVIVTLPNAAELYEGTSSLAPFPVRYIRLYRFPSLQDARAGLNGTFVHSWDLDPAVEQYGWLDTSQTSATVYAYRLESDTDATPFSEPWRPNINLHTLASVLLELQMMLSDIIRRTSATYVSASSFSFPELADPLATASFWAGWDALPLVGTGFAHARITAHDTSSATVNGSLPSWTGTVTVLLSAIARWEQVLDAVNYALSEMQTLEEHHVPAATGPHAEPVFRLPWGVRSPSDIVDAVWYMADDPTPRPALWEVLPGNPPEVIVRAPPHASRASLWALTSFADIDGQLAALEHVTTAPLHWLVPTAAYQLIAMLADQDPQDQALAVMRDRYALRAREAAGKYAPERRSQAFRQRAAKPLPGPSAAPL